MWSGGRKKYSMDKASLRVLVERLVREELARVRAQRGPVQVCRQVVTAADIEDAARRGANLRVGNRSVITPLAWDRARELGVEIDVESTG